MSNAGRGRTYAGLKWSWLLFQCLMLPLAAWHVAGQPEWNHPSWAGGAAWLMGMVGVVYLVLWLIAEALLIMYRFPLDTPGAFKLVAGHGIQLAVLVLAGGSVFFAAFVSITVTLGALYGCLVLLLGYLVTEDLRRRRPVNRRLLLGLALCIPGLLPFGFLFPFLAAGFHRYGRAALAATGAVLLVNTVMTARSIIDFSVWGRPDPLQPRYDEEWESWAGPTIILLILSSVAAVTLAGIRGA